MARLTNIYGEPPPGWDPGHPIMPNLILQNAARVYGMLNAVGTLLDNVELNRVASRKGGYAEIIANGVHNRIGEVALLIQDRMTEPSEYDKHLFDDMSHYTYDKNGFMYLNGKRVKDVQRTVPAPAPVNDVYNQAEPNGYEQEYYEEEIPSTYVGSTDYKSNNRTENMANVNQYLNLGGQRQVVTRPAAPATTTTITFVDLQNANKPIVDKLEIVCQLLGKIWGVEMETQKLINELPESIAELIDVGGTIMEDEPEDAEAILQAVQADADAQELTPESYLPTSEPAQEEHVQNVEVAEPKKPRRVKTKKQ